MKLLELKGFLIKTAQSKHLKSMTYQVITHCAAPHLAPYLSEETEDASRVKIAKMSNSLPDTTIVSSLSLLPLIRVWW